MVVIADLVRAADTVFTLRFEVHLGPLRCEPVKDSKVVWSVQLSNNLIVDGEHSCRPVAVVAREKPSVM